MNRKLLLLSFAVLTGSASAETNELATLDQARLWLAQNPPTRTNTTERRKRMSVIQQACDRVAPADYWAYVKTWDDRNGRAERLEKAQPALGHWRACTTNAIAELRRTKVTHGVAAWHLYNMGYVFKTPAASFGIDLHGRGVEELAADLDFLLATHEHADHSSPALLKAMLSLRKPVVTRWFPGSTIVGQATNLTFGGVHVQVDIGDHYRGRPQGDNNMLMFAVDCGVAGNNAVIYHSGDGSNFAKMRPAKPVDLFIVHVNVGMSVPEAIQHLKPKMTLVSHVMELGHSPVPPQAWRWSYEYAFNVIRNIPEAQATVLTWGERWLLPGTELAGVVLKKDR